MAMPTMTTMNVLGALGSSALHAMLPLAGAAPQSAKEQAPFAEMLATAGVASAPLVASNMNTATPLGASTRPIAVDPVVTQTMSTIVEPTHGIAVRTPYLELASPEAVDALPSAPFDSATNMPMPKPVAQAFEANPSKPTVVFQAAPSNAAPLIAGSPKSDVIVTASKEPVVVVPAKASPTVFVASESAEASVPEVSAPALAAKATVTLPTSRAAALPLRNHASALSNEPLDAAFSDKSTQAPGSNVPASAFSPKSLVPANSREESSVVIASDAPAFADPVEVPMKDGERVKVPQVAVMKAAGAANGLKAHSSAASTQESKIRDIPAPESSHVEPVVIAGVGVVAQPVVLQTIAHETMGPAIALESTAVSAKPGSVDRLKQPLAAGPTTTIAQEASPIEQTTPTPLQSAQEVVVEQAQPFAIPVSPALAAAVKTIRKLSSEEVKSGPQRHTQGAPTAISAPVTEIVVVAPLAPTAPASESRHSAAQDAAIFIAVAPHAVVAATPVTETHRASLMQGAVSAQLMENVGPAQPGLAHTTLNASPTVLEVGIPGGSHGWLKIRAEMGEGGNVQASLFAATRAGHETLHRELPELTAFLASEHLTVQLNVADRPQVSASSVGVEHDRAQASTGGERNGGERRERPQEESAASLSFFVEDRESAWTSFSYASSTVLHGGSWVNVVA